MIKQASKADTGTVAKLAILLWPDNEEESLREEFDELLADEHAAVFLYEEKGQALGFAQVQLRHDYVEGTQTSPVGYLEGIYVSPGSRNKGIAQQLLTACEQWAKGQGCAEFASDCTLDNVDSQAFHQSVGFIEAERIVCFTKKI